MWIGIFFFAYPNPAVSNNADPDPVAFDPVAFLTRNPDPALKNL